jgi:hypothetical protein
MIPLALRSLSLDHLSDLTSEQLTLLLLDGGAVAGLARLIGDNHNDPTLIGDADVFWTGHDPDGLSLTGPQGVDISGTVTSGGNGYLIDTGQDFWGGVLITHTGVASGGSSLSLTDSSKAASSFWTHPERGRWLGHMVEVLEPDSDPPIWHKRPITSHTGATIGWDLAMPFSAASCDYRIREPLHELNKWRGRTITITPPGGGEPLEVTVTHSDDTSIWFEPAENVVDGSTWSIIDQHFGEVYANLDGEWAVSDGIDVRTGSEFPADKKNIQPSVVKRYGRFMKDDYLGAWIFEQINAAIDELQWTLAGFTWTNKGENNVAAGSRNATNIGEFWGPGQANATYDDAWSAAMTYITGEYPPLPVIVAVDNQIPYQSIISGAASGGLLSDDNGSVGPLSGDGAYSYVKISGYPTLLSATADFYGWGVVDVDDPDEDMAADWPDRVVNDFDPNATGLNFRAWGLLDSLSLESDGETIGTEKIGEVVLGVPNFVQPADPLTASGGTGDYTSIVHSGFYILRKTAILKWSMPE